MSKTEELQVFLANREGECAECGAEITKMEMITLKRPSGVLCLECSDLDHLVYLPSGDVALTRRARKYSPLSVVVLMHSKSRKRNERQGVLVSSEGLNRAEEECLSDEDLRAKRRERDRIRAEKKDAEYVQRFADAIRKLYPSCPVKTASVIAEHACEKYSGRVGRAAGAKELDDSFVKLAVRAHVRHAETNYDELLAKFHPRDLARELVGGQIENCLARWMATESS